MRTVTIAIAEDLSVQLEPYRDNLEDLLCIGLREVRKEQSLALFKKGTSPSGGPPVWPGSHYVR